jgi:DNA-binding IscR family transcriptional regulator
MSLSPHEIAELRKIVSIAEKILAKAMAPMKRAKLATSTKPRKNPRRKGRELVAFRKTVLAERKRGIPVAEIARKHGITPNYIYQIT